MVKSFFSKLDQTMMVSVIVASVVVFFSIAYSHHGLLDYREFQKETDLLKSRIAELEVQNAELRRKIDLVRRPTDSLREQHAREYFNWVKPGDLIFFEDGMIAQREFPKKPKVQRSPSPQSAPGSGSKQPSKSDVSRR